MRQARIVGLVGIMLVVVAGISLAAETPGLTMHYYADSVFFAPGGEMTVPSLSINLDLNTLKWPAGVKREGWSLTVSGAIQVEKAGAYAFKCEGNRAELFVAGHHVKLDGSEAVELPGGAAMAGLMVRAEPDAKNANARAIVRWQGPGMANFQDIPAAALCHTTADEGPENLYRNWVPLSHETTPIYNRRSFTVTLPTAGFWELTGPRRDQVPIWQVWCDGHPLYYRKARVNVPDEKVGLFGECSAVRYLPAGKHEITIFTHSGPWIWDDNIDEVLKTTTLGFLLLGPDSPEPTLGVTVEGRADLVFRLGEPLTLRLEEMTGARFGYRVDVRRQRENDAVIWSARTVLPANEHAVARVTYPCDKEGAFEYLVSDDHGKLVDGPWAFVVVDARNTLPPTPSPKIGAGVPETARTAGDVAPALQLVDTVDCTQAEEAGHVFRDNGTSYVVETPAGKYRSTGPHPIGTRSYLKENGLWRETKPGESPTKSFPTMDWFAYTMHVKHPGMPHLLVAWVPNDIHRVMALQVFDQVSGQCQAASLEVGNAPQAPGMVPLRICMWPNGDIDVHTFNFTSPSQLYSRQAAYAKFELYECPNGLGTLPQAAAGWDTDKQFGFCGEQMDIGMEQRMTPKLWKGDQVLPQVIPPSWGRGDGYYDWKAFQQVWDRFGQYAQWFGQNLIIWPVYTYGSQTVLNTPAMPAYWEAYSGGYPGGLVDQYQRDMFKMELLEAEKHHVKFVADFMVQRVTTDYLVSLSPEWKDKTDGMMVTNLRGVPENIWGMTPSPAHPAARKFLLEFVREMAQQYGKYPAFGGIYTRQWDITLGIDGWWAGMNYGYDDFTVNLFSKETGVKMPVLDGPKRFTARHDWLLANAKAQWIKWRCDQVYSLRKEMLAELQQYAPQAHLWSDSGPDIGKGIDPEQVKGQPELGWVGHAHYASPGFECNAIDPTCWQNFDQRLPEAQRPTMQQRIETQSMAYPVGLCTGTGSGVRPYPYVLAGAAESLAKGEGLDTMLWGGTWILVPMDEGLRSFVQTWRALPRFPYTRVAGSPDEAVIAWQVLLPPGWSISSPAQRGRELVYYLVNRTPYMQSVTVKLQGGVGAQDMVSGKTLSSASDVTLSLPPYMLALLHSWASTPVKTVRYPDGTSRVSGGEMGISAVTVNTPPAFVAEVRAQLAHLEAINKLGGDHALVLSGAGEKYVTVKWGKSSSDDANWGRRDLTVKLPQLLAPIETAVREQHWGQAQLLLDNLRIDHPWWYEAYGWPTGHYIYQQPEGAYAKAEAVAAALKLPASCVQRVAGVPGTAVVVPGGKATMDLKADTAGAFDLKVWMLSGQGCGPVQVTVDGRKVGQMGVGDAPAHYAHFRLPAPLGLLDGNHVVGLESAGKLVITAVEISPIVPTCLKQWAAIGAFEGKPGWGWGSMDMVFPPEKGIDLNATYTGLDGKPIQWQQIDIGEDKFIQLLERYFPYDNLGRQGIGVAYLAQWVYAPTARDVTLYDAQDWFLNLWINGKLTVDHISGPWYNYETRTIHLEKGWNTLLFKVAPGSTSWRANYALSDPGDEKFQSMPPG